MEQQSPISHIVVNNGRIHKGAINVKEGGRPRRGGASIFVFRCAVRFYIHTISKAECFSRLRLCQKRVQRVFQKPSFEEKTKMQWPVASGQWPVGSKKPSFWEKTRFHAQTPDGSGNYNHLMRVTH